jgi:hypothetical protein
VKRCAEALWDRGDEESIDESSEGSKGTPTAEKSNAGGGKRKKKKSTRDDDDAWMTGINNIPPSEDDTNSDSSEEETLGPRKKKRKGTSGRAVGRRESLSTADLCAELLKINAANMKTLLDAHSVTGLAMAATGTSASKLSTARLLALEKRQRG